jgi:hypothetical protein
MLYSVQMFEVHRLSIIRGKKGSQSTQAWSKRNAATHCIHTVLMHSALDYRQGQCPKICNKLNQAEHFQYRH